MHAADASAAVARSLSSSRLSTWREPDLVIATGKAAASMAASLDAGVRGIVLLPRDAPAPSLPSGLRVLRADHPIPTAAGIAASREVLNRVRGLEGGQRLLYLVSGGTSSLFEVPAPGLDEAGVIEVYRLLLDCGAPIHELNVVRRALSAVKGGGLLRATAADILTLAISDVAGDDPATIGSGPTVAKDESPEAALAVIERFGLRGRLPQNVLQVLAAPRERPPILARDRGFHVICSVSRSIDAAAEEMRCRGYELIPPELARLEGDAVAAGASVAATIREALRVGAKRRAFVLGGETTLAVPAAAGRGGRNQHLAAYVAVRLEGVPGFALACGGTDGMDGRSEYAGGVVDGGTSSRVRAAGLDLDTSLRGFDTSTALAASGDVLRTGSTGTNVGDVLVAACSPG